MFPQNYIQFQEQNEVVTLPFPLPTFSTLKYHFNCSYNKEKEI